MRFKTRILLASVLVIWVPLTVLALITRSEMNRRLSEEHRRRVDALITVVNQDLETRKARIEARLADLGTELVDDNRFRLVAVEGLGTEKAYVLDYAERAMRMAGLSMLQIQDEEGRILSSGHFRNEYGRVEPELHRMLTSVPERVALVEARSPRGPFLCLSGVVSFPLGARTFFLIGGEAVGTEFLSRLTRDANLSVSLVYPGGAQSSHDDLATRLGKGVADPVRGWERAFPEDRFIRETRPIAFAGPDGVLGEAVLIAAYSKEPLQRILQSLDAWLLAVMGGAVIGTFVLARWSAARVSKPLEELALKTLSADLDRHHVDFSTRRGDEVGDLSRFLDDMMRRLSKHVRLLRDAEHRAAMGQFARQVNHDIKNGLTPIRNTFRHLTQVAKDDPAELASVYRDRSEVLGSSLDYLENLAGNYAKLYRPGAKERCDLNAIIAQVSRSRDDDGLIKTDTYRSLPAVEADPLTLHRIVDNLVTNAVDSVREAGGSVTVKTEEFQEKGRFRVRLIVSDTGKGLTEEEQTRIFDDFYTTKEHGTGLGLSIVRRMVTDSEGRIRVESKPGEGARFILEFPGVAKLDLGLGDQIPADTDDSGEHS